jgi:hypothetical protein
MGFLVSVEISSKNGNLKISNFSLINKLLIAKRDDSDIYDKVLILNFLENENNIIINKEKFDLINQIKLSEKVTVVENYRCTISNKFSKNVYSVE